jgi:ACS family tartrate transporter-like MFS transporter
MDMNGIGETTIARLNARIVPLFLITYVINFLDRVNIGFASLQMNGRLGFGPAVYGFGAGIFFLGYFIFQVPSNLVLARLGSRRWLAPTMIVWGVISAMTALVTTPPGFYLVRFLLGAAEAGFVPAVLVYLGNWYPAQYRASAVAKVWSATAVAIVIGGPLSALLLRFDGTLGLAGWQWMFLVEAAPAIILGVVLLWVLNDRPEEAEWLTPKQRDWLIDQLDAERPTSHGGVSDRGIITALRDLRTRQLGALYFCLGIGFFGITLWLPQVVRQIGGLSDSATGLVSAIPFGCAIIAMIVVANHSDRSGERRPYMIGGCLVAASGFALSGQIANPVLALAALSVGAMGLWSVIGIFWQLPATFLTGASAPVGIAIINACGSLGGFVGPYLIGSLRGVGAGFGVALFVIAGAMALAAALAARFAWATRGDLVALAPALRTKE